jgi:hypothetical protein
MGPEMVRSSLCFALISVGIIGAALGLGAHNASAADDCITESNVIPPKGSRWHYDIDRATNRKCWHIVALSIASHASNTQRTSPRSTPGLAVRSKHQVSESGQVAATQRITIRSTAGQATQHGRPPPRTHPFYPRLDQRSGAATARERRPQQGRGAQRARQGGVLSSSRRNPRPIFRKSTIPGFRPQSGRRGHHPLEYCLSWARR